MSSYRRRRIVASLILVFAALAVLITSPDNYQVSPATTTSKALLSPASQALGQLEIKGRASKTGYARSQFGDGWQLRGGCDMRNIILARDLENLKVDANCKVISGQLHDPYSAKQIAFLRGPDTSALVQIDHVVALSDAWQKGAQQLSFSERQNLANDPLNLLAVDGSQNQTKSSSDAASWLPDNKMFRCQYVARQIAVKLKYELSVTAAEKQAMQTVLSRCPDQKLPTAL